MRSRVNFLLFLKILARIIFTLFVHFIISMLRLDAISWLPPGLARTIFGIEHSDYDYHQTANSKRNIENFGKKISSKYNQRRYKSRFSCKHAPSIVNELGTWERK